MTVEVMGALDCVTPNKMSETGSTEVFTINMASNTSLNEPRRDLESQISKSNNCSRKHSYWWHLVIDLPLFVTVTVVIVLFEFGVIPSQKIGFFCNDPALSYPYTGETVSPRTLMSTLICLPIIIIFLTELVFTEADSSCRTRLMRTVRRTLTLLRNFNYGLIFNLLVVEIVKGITGNPRPTFFAVCEPDTAKTCTGSEFVSTFQCTSSHYSDYMKLDSYRSFPSGHTSMSVHCGLFLAWYLQRRAFSWRHRTVLWVPVLQCLSLIYSAICSLSRITDHRHHWWDVLAGTTIGVLSVLYTVYCLCDNFSYAKKRKISADDNQQSIQTLLYEGR